MKVTLITGASGGIGEAFAKRLAGEGHNLLLVARSENKLQAVCKQLTEQHGIVAHYIAADLAKEGSDKKIADEVAGRGFEVNWLINNAGIGTGGDLLEYSLEDYQNMMRLNMEAVVALTYRFLPRMRANRSGVIINVGSMAGFGPIPYMNVYAATKGFMMYFTEALWEENRPYGIQTMLLCPGATETGFFDAAKIGSDRKSSFSTKKMETPDEVVTSALKGLRRGKMITVSGTQNKIARRLLPLFPTRLGLRLWGNLIRKNLNLQTGKS